MSSERLLAAASAPTYTRAPAAAAAAAGCCTWRWHTERGRGGGGSALQWQAAALRTLRYHPPRDTCSAATASLGTHLEVAVRQRPGASAAASPPSALLLTPTTERASDHAGEAVWEGIRCEAAFDVAGAIVAHLPGGGGGGEMGWRGVSERRQKLRGIGGARGDGDGGGGSWEWSELIDSPRHGSSRSFWAASVHYLKQTRESRSQQLAVKGVKRSA